MDTPETATVEVTQASKAAIARGAPIIIAKDDYAMAERVIENWCVKGDKRKTRQLIAEGIALARDEARIAAALLRDANSHYSAGQIEEIERCHRTRATRQDGLREATIEECAELAENWNPGRRDRVTETGIANAIRALSDSSTREESGAGEADEHYAVAMERRPKEIGGVAVGPGLYRIHWKSGGSSLAAIGMCANGAWWVAPTNWVTPAVAFRIDESPTGEWSWAGVDALEKIEPDAPATNAGDALREAGWSYVAALPMWSVAVVTDGERVAIAQKAEADFDGYYWAIEPEDALDWEPTHCIALPAALSASPDDQIARIADNITNGRTESQRND